MNNENKKSVTFLKIMISNQYITNPFFFERFTLSVSTPT